MREEGQRWGKSGGGGASPTDAVMYEVAFLMWRVGNSTPARAVLNRASIWAEWERRPSRAGRGSQRSRSSGSRHKEKQQSRSSSFVGFMSMVGGLGAASGATTKMITPHGSSQRSSPPKGPTRPAAAPVHRCDFSPGICVRTATFGPAIVVKFRAEEGMYQASLVHWRLQTGRLASAYLSRTAIVTAIAVPGAAVRTPVGLGNVDLVREEGVLVIVSRAGGGDGGAISSDRMRARGARSGNDVSPAVFLHRPG